MGKKFILKNYISKNKIINIKRFSRNFISYLHTKQRFTPVITAISRNILQQHGLMSWSAVGIDYD